MHEKREIASYFENMSLFVLGAFLFLFPLVFSSATTDAFVLPKQILLAIAVTLFVALFGLKTLADGKLKMRSSPFDLPVVIFLVVALLSSFFSVNRFDAFTALVPLLFTVFLYFGVTNVVKNQKQLFFVLSSLVLGGVVSALLSLLSFFKIYPLPFQYTHVQFFNTFGSLLDQAIYLALLLPITGYFAVNLFGAIKGRTGSVFAVAKGSKNGYLPIAYAVSFGLLAISFIVTVYMLLTSQKPLILPFDMGLQTGFAAISQDTGNVLKSFILGSGLGTYLIDFTRFKPAGYNVNPNLWAFTFFRSSSFILELLATTGLLGLASYLFLIFKVVKEKNYFLPLILAIVASVLLPFSFTLITLLFILLAIFAVVRINANPERFTELEFYLVALKKGLFVAAPEGERIEQNSREKRYSRLLPWVFFVFMLVVVGIPMYFTTTFFISDIVFQKSLVAASQNNGLQTYNLQVSALKIFPYRDVYYRAFSQTNLALANSLAISQARSGKPNQQVQQNILTLIQQSITAGRSATSVAPYTAFNWNNLSAIYRSLIGFGQNAERFTVITLQQAVNLDPNNPQQYVELGGVYYQLGLYDDAIRQFQLAINLKNDYANAYYNLGHALEMKNDLQGAFTAYQTVKALVGNNADNEKRIDADITALKNKASQGQQAQPQASASANVTPAPEQQPIDVNKPSTQLPERNPKAKIPAPTVSQTNAKSQAKPSL